MHQEARYWRTLPDGRIRCDLCPRRCSLREGQRGFCFVRQVTDGRLVSTTYGRSTGFCIDPIEKKPLNHFLPGTAVLSFGTAGCNLGCRFCQNWDISKSRQVERLCDLASPDSIARAAAESGCDSVAFTYNDPVTWIEYVVDTAMACHDRGIKTVAVTAGYVTGDARRELFSHIDGANVDLKAFTPDFYRRLCLAELTPVLETLAYLKQSTDVWLEVTTLLIPGENDGAAEIGDLCAWFADELGLDVPLHFTAFHPDYKLRHLPPTPRATLNRAREIAQEHGLRYVYTGNIPDVEGGTTRCPSCRGPVIVRAGYDLVDWRLTDGHCMACGALVPGVFRDRPGGWGAGRAAIALR